MRLVSCNVRRAMFECGKSQSTVARETGLSVGTVSLACNMDAGKRMVSLVTLSRMAQAVGVSTSDLLKGCDI